MMIEPECRSVSIASVWRIAPELSVALEGTPKVGKQNLDRATGDQVSGGPLASPSFGSALKKLSRS